MMIDTGTLWIIGDLEEAGHQPFSPQAHNTKPAVSHQIDNLSR
jgi:hypothetical protein